MYNYIFFGEGYRAKVITAELDALGIKPLAYVTTDGALSLDEVQRLYPDAEYVLALYNDNEIKIQLKERGLRFLSVWDLYTRHGGEHFSEYEFMRGFTEQEYDAEKIVWAGELFTDSRSQQLYQRLIEWRFHHNDSLLPTKDDASNTYFDIPLSDYEVFVDCGAYTGDTTREFIKRTHGKYNSIYAFEPDVQTFSQLDAEDYRMHKISAAVGEFRGTMGFVPGIHDRAAGRVVNGEGIPVIPLDMLSCKPTFIKMDIEGSEAAALRGAKKILTRYRPKLAIVLYHRPTDIFEIPLLIKSIEPSYNFKLYKYADSCWETVLYATC